MTSRFALALLALTSSSAFAAPNSARFAFTSVPTLDDVGLVGLTLVVAIAGAFAVRRRKKK
jgi:hypothetical protein